MHNAPSVSYPVGRSLFLGALLVAVWTLGLGVLLLAGSQIAPKGWLVVMAAATWGLAGLLAWRFWRAMPQGELRWDGQAWAGPGASNSPCEVRAHLDLQRHLLVQLQGGDAAVQWLWLSAAASPERWNDLRRAVYSRAIRVALQDGVNP